MHERCNKNVFEIVLLISMLVTVLFDFNSVFLRVSSSLCIALQFSSRAWAAGARVSEMMTMMARFDY